MLRDKNLIPLSHQHQHCLALCVRLDRAIQAGEVDLEAWQAEIEQMFEQEITFHFAAQPNIEGITAGDVHTDDIKRGWDYVWFSYVDAVSGSVSASSTRILQRFFIRITP